MLEFDRWSNAMDLRNKIIELDSTANVESEINTVIEDLKNNGATDKELRSFVEHLNTLFLTYLVTEGQDHSKTNDNVKKAREILKNLESKLKRK